MRHQKRIQRQPDEYDRIVAIDPGRVNLVAALDSSTHKTGRLTRKEYYPKGRINRLNEKTTLWEIPLRGVVSALSKTSIRTSSPSPTYAYRQVIAHNSRTPRASHPRTLLVHHLYKVRVSGRQCGTQHPSRFQDRCSWTRLSARPSIWSTTTSHANAVEIAGGRKK